MPRPRSENVADAQALRADGVPVKEIAARMGVHYKTVHDWLVDPTGVRLNARKRAQDRAVIEARRCPRCGGPMGSRNSSVCQRCYDAAIDERVGEILGLRAEGLSNAVIEARLGLPYNAVASALWRARRRGVAIPRAPYFDRKGTTMVTQQARATLERDAERTQKQIATREQEIADLRAYLAGVEAALEAFDRAVGPAARNGADVHE